MAKLPAGVFPTGGPRLSPAREGEDSPRLPTGWHVGQLAAPGPAWVRWEDIGPARGLVKGPWIPHRGSSRGRAGMQSAGAYPSALCLHCPGGSDGAPRRLKGFLQTRGCLQNGLGTRFTHIQPLPSQIAWLWSSQGSLLPSDSVSPQSWSRLSAA